MTSKYYRKLFSELCPHCQNIGLNYCEIAILDIWQLGTYLRYLGMCIDCVYLFTGITSV